MRQQVKRVVAIIMTVAMLVGLFPLEVFAQNSQRAADPTQTLTTSVDKVLTILGLSLHNLHTLSVEALQAGSLSGPNGETRPIPRSLQEALRHYCETQGRTSGPIFVNSQGEPLNRGSITAAIHALAPLAHLPPAQCNLRSLHRLYQDTREAMAKELAYLVEQMHERLLEQEEMTIGWRESTPPDADDS